MSVNLLFKIAAVGILVSVLGQVLKHSGREEQAYLASLAGLVLVLFWVLPYISQLFESCLHCDQNCSSWDYRDFTGVVSQR